MATVYKAFDPNTDRFVALKILPEHLSSNPDFRTRFQREAKAIARLEHLHILPVFAYGEDGQIAYLVMRYMQAGTLSERVESGPLSLDEIDRLLKQVASALDYAHKQGVLHRDVKPKNVLLDEYGNSYLTDFGIAKIVETTTDLTGNSILGTPKYMSPEQCRGEKKLTPATDIYSLGIVLFEMLTGQPPFDAETPIAVIHMQLNEPLPLPRSLRPEIPEGVEMVVLRALAKRPEDRYTTASEMARAFHEALSSPAPATTQTAGEHDEGSTYYAPPSPASPASDRATLVDEGQAEHIHSEPLRSQRANGRQRPSWVWVAAGGSAVLVVAVAAALLWGLARSGPSNRQAAAPPMETPTASTTSAANVAPSPQTTPPNNPELAAALSDPWGHVAIPAGGHIRVGLALAFTGGDLSSPAVAADQERAARLAIIEFGPISGFGVSFSVADSNCSSAGGSKAAETLASQPDLVGVVGTTCSSAMRTAMTVFDQDKIVVITPSATADGLNSDGLPTFDRTAYADSANPAGSGPAAYLNSQAYQDFSARFSDAFSHPCCQPFTAESYDAMAILLSTIDAVAVPDGQGGIVIPREALAQGVRGTHGFQSVTGAISFDLHGNRVAAR